MYDPAYATFKPRRTDDLKPDSVRFVGCSGVFEPLWRIEAGHEYAGEIAMMVPRDWGAKGFNWVPSGDLEP